MPDFPGLGMGVYVLALAVVFAGALVQGATGMGFGQVVAPMLLLIDNRFVPGAALCMGLAAALLPAIRDRRNIAVRELGFAVSGRAVGALGAGFIIAFVDKTAFSLMFAGLVLAAVGLSLVKWRVRPTARSLLVAGTMSGFMGTITSIGAPPMGIVYQHSPGAHVRATLNGFFAVGTVVSLGALSLFGLIGRDDVVLALMLVPALVLGSWTSKYCTRFVDKAFRPIVLTICTTSAVLIVWKSLA